MEAVRSILFVDDDRVVRQLFTRLLVKRGYRVSWAADRQEALTMFSKQNFDVVIAELHLRSSPNGLDILQEFQNLQPTIGKILITSTDPESVEKSVNSLGAICIPKPVKIDELVASIQRVAV
jgi:two-component system, OmpR family, response regulator